MNNFLIYPPIADPTQPYLSLPVLKGFLENKNIKIKLIDLNIAAVNDLFHRGNILTNQKLINKKFAFLNNKKFLSFIEQLEYKKLYEALLSLEKINSQKLLPLEVFKNKKYFYDFNVYKNATVITEEFFIVYNALAFPFEISFNKLNHFLLPWNFSLIDFYYKNKKNPFNLFYENYLKTNIYNPDLIGISITFINQIPDAFYFAMLIKEKYPDCFIIIGGTAAHQIFKYSTDETKKYFFKYADMICLYEGEYTLQKLITFLEKIKNKNKLLDDENILKQIPNIAVKKSSKLFYSDFQKTDLNDTYTPDYSDFNLNKYLAPEKILLYSPTRGCYWKKCSFCDYGFKTEYKEIPVKNAINEIITLKEKYNVNNFYLSGDVISPKYLIKFAKAIIENSISIKWSCDLRIEEEYSKEICVLLYRSGLRSVAFGVESGSDKILKLINKGLTKTTIKKINKNFYSSGIATQWMTFTFHPGETTNDAAKTIDLINSQKNYISLFIIGEFGLTSGSIIFQKPGDFFIDKIYYVKGDKFKLYPMFTLNKKIKNFNSKKIDEEINILAKNFNLNHYPWAGAISTHHSFLYFIKFGKNAFNSNNNKKTIKTNKPLKIKTKANYLLTAIEKNINKFLSNYLHEALTPLELSDESSKIYQASLSLDDFKEKVNNAKTVFQKK